MRNLKRALSLVLAAMMLIGMMVVSAGAASKDFTDKDEIVNTEAVNTLVTLNVIAGKNDGSYFDPTGIVTRAEMAKMITVVLNGGREPNLGTKLTPSYSDIKGHWAEAYIEYCTSMGIIAGRGNGKFDPDATVTGSEAAKMVLIAMGYSAENSKFVGDSWEINVNATASSKGLYDDMSVVASAPLNRDNAALMVFNGLNAKMVEYDYKLNTVNGNLVTVAIAKDRNVTLLNDKFDLVTKYAYLTDASYNSDKGEYTYTLSTAATMGSDAIATDGYAKTSYTTDLDYTNLFGMKVAVLSKSTDGEVYGLFAEDSKVLGTGVVGDIKDVSGTEFKLGDVKYELTDAAASTPVWDLYGAENAKNLSNVNAAGGPNKYNAISLIDNTGDGKVDVVIMTPVTPVKVSFSSKTSFTYAPAVDAVSSVKYEDVNTGNATFAKGDILLATSKTNAVDGKTTFVKAETVSGKIAAQKTGEFQVNGTWYKAATMAGSESIALGDTVKLTVVNGYYVYAEKTSSTSTDLLVVTAKSATADLDGNYDAKVVFTDGTISTVKIDNGTVGSLYTYELKDGVYELTAATTGNTGYDSAVTATYDASEEKLTDGTRIADDAVVIVRYNTNDVKVISGAELKKWNTDFGTSAIGFANDVNGFTTAQVIVLTDSASSLPSTGDEVYGYIVSDPYAGKKDSDYYIYFDMWNGTETVSVKDKVASSSFGAPYVKGTLVSYTDEGNGVVDGTAAVSTTDGAVVAYDGKIVKIANSSTAVELKITDDTKIYYINTKDVAGVEGGEIAMADEVSTNTYNCNVKYTVVNTNEVGVLFVDVNNNIEGSSTVSYGA